ncbi:MAG: hypothetical protein PF588_06475 [Candidatus Kapabacteria bacterium]|jgi:hypothetical protein|nr:hypothetical protein [Candidatus Kapabacteria bacterium]
MKSFILLLAALLIFSTSDSIAKKKGAKSGPYNMEQADLNIGLGLGGSAFAGDMTIPPISASYEVGFTDKISGGGFLAYAGSEYKYSWGTWSYTNIIIGARASYHFYSKDKIDAYGGLMIGYNIVSSSWEANSGYSDYNQGDASSSALIYSIIGGAR